MDCGGMPRYGTVLLAYIFCVGISLAAADTGSNEWDHLVFAQQWPQSVCYDMNTTSGYKHLDNYMYKSRVCKIPANVHTWTIHGVWPTRTGSKEEPNCCNNTYKFQPDQVKDLEGQLNIYWPDLFATDESHYELWKHEWVKHGTCGLDYPPLRGEHNYFSTGLKLNRQYDFSNILAQSNIKPSDDNKYKLADLKKAFAKVLKVKIYMQCAVHHKSPVQYLEQVQICLNKTTPYQLIDCPPKSLAGLGIRSHNPCKKAEGVKLQMNQAGLLTGFAGMQPCDDTKGIMYPVIKH